MALQSKKREESYYAFLKYYILYDPEASPPWHPDDFFLLLMSDQLLDLGVDLHNEMNRRKYEQILEPPSLPDIGAFERNPIPYVRLVRRLTEDQIRQLLRRFSHKFVHENCHGMTRDVLMKIYSESSGSQSEEDTIQLPDPYVGPLENVNDRARLTTPDVKIQASGEEEANEAVGLPEIIGEELNTLHVGPDGNGIVEIIQPNHDVNQRRKILQSLFSMRTKRSSASTFVTATSARTSESFYTASARTSLLSSKRLSMLTT